MINRNQIRRTLRGTMISMALLVAAVLQRVDQWQRRFALRKVVAGVLAHGRVIARVVEHVVDELEGGAQVHTVPRQGLLGLRSRVLESFPRLKQFHLLDAVGRKDCDALIIQCC